MSKNKIVINSKEQERRREDGVYRISILTSTAEELKNYLQSTLNLKQNVEYFTIFNELICVLKNRQDSKVYLIGTNHISPNSAAAAKKLIEIVKPHIVVTELDRSRAGLNANSEVFSGYPHKFNYLFLRKAMKEFGFMGSLIYFSLAHMESFIGRLFRVNWGADLRSPFLRMRGALDFMPSEFTRDKPYDIMLGDRPIEITIKRMGACLNPNKKTFVIISVFTSIFLGLKCLLLPVSTILQSSEKFTNVLLHERDVYLTYSLQLAADLKFSDSTKVIGIVGKDHVPGIVKLWNTVSKEDVENITKTD